MSALRDAMVEHWAQLKELSGETVTYARQGQIEATLVMVPGLQTITLETVEGVTVSRKESDFLIGVEDFAVTGFAKPQRRDRVTSTYGAMPRTVVVRPLANEREYDTVDQYGVMIRVHAREVAE